MNILCQKFPIRVLLEGGPLIQPGFYAAIKVDEALLEHLKTDHGEQGIPFRDLSSLEVLSSGEQTLSIEQIVSDILSGRRESFIFKPNSGSTGDGVTFFERTNATQLRMTMAGGPTTIQSVPRTQSAIRYFKRAGVGLLEFIPGDRLQISLPLDTPDLSGLLVGFWEALSAQYGYVSRPHYDAGMVEGILPAEKYKGMAYEIRYIFRGNLATGLFDDAGKESESSHLDKFYAREGLSNQFANQIHRDDQLSSNSGEAALRPLYEMFDIPLNQRSDFQEYVELLMKKEFFYLSDRLRAAGITLNASVKGSFDVQWLAPDHPGGFPRPALIEADFDGLEKSILNENLTVRKTEKSYWRLQDMQRLLIPLCFIGGLGAILNLLVLGWHSGAQPAWQSSLSLRSDLAKLAILVPSMPYAPQSLLKRFQMRVEIAA